VLVADDEFGILLVLEMALSDAGYRVVTAANGRQAVEMAMSDPPDLIIMDWMMPVMDGLAAATAMRSNLVLARVPVIMMSGASEAFVRARFQDYAAFLHKPFLDTEVLAAVERVLGHSRRD